MSEPLGKGRLRFQGALDGKYGMITLSYSNKQLCRQNQLTRAAIRCHHYLVGSSSQRSVNRMEFATLGNEDTRLLLPPTKIVNESDVERLSETTTQLLSDRPDPPDFQAEVCGIFEELMINAIQHSPSDRPHRGRSESEQRRNRSYAMLEYSECCSNGLFSICVRDTGSGIRSSLRNSNKELSDAAAIKYATERSITGTQEDRGIGLYHVKTVTTAHGGCLCITSGHGAAIGGNGLPNEIVKELSPIQGTLSFAALFVPDSK